MASRKLMNSAELRNSQCGLSARWQLVRQDEALLFCSQSLMMTAELVIKKFQMKSF